jgi:tRNA pseudouridine55 synthase
MDGFLLVNKPKNMTSHDVVFKLKKKFHLDKIGHTGTLDPFASGLLILCLGKATKLAHLFSNQDKSYEGVIVFGKHYDTYDVTGKVIKETDQLIDESTINKVFLDMIGKSSQLPPMYSAIKIEGKKLYELARDGIEIDRDLREIEIKELTSTSQLENNKLSFYTKVSKGTYIRSLAVDIAHRLNTYGALEELKRTSVGNYLLNQAKNIDEITNSDIISLVDYFKDTNSIILNDYMIRLVKNGIYLDERQVITDAPFIVRNSDNEMIAYYEVVENNKYKPVLIF